VRVRCERFFTTIGVTQGNESDSGPGGLTRGEDYLALAIRAEMQPDKGIMSTLLLVLDDYREPQWVPAATFSVLSNRLPSNWKVDLGESGALNLAPEPWLAPEFWGNYYSEDTAAAIAHDVYRKELATMEAEDRAERV